MAAEETLYAEVLSAIDAGDRARARDLLTRLLKINQENPQYWLWMSALVESAKERVYCLKEVLRRDPNNETARRGLLFHGAAPIEAATAPAPVIRRNWQAGMQSQERARPTWKTGLTAGGGVLLLALVLLGIFGGRLFGLGREQNAPRLPTVDAALVQITTPTATAAPTLAAQGSPQPLALSLDATYTPTPLAVNTPHPRTEAYRAALRAYERGEWRTALNYYQQVATAEPDALDAFFYMGEVNRQMGDLDAALDAYRETLARDSNFAPAHLGLARALLAQDVTRNGKEARAALETALELDPDLNEAYWVLADLLLEQGDPQAALDALAAAPPEAQNSPLYALAHARARLAADQPAQAVTEARRAIQLDLTLLDAYRLLGEALQRGGNVKGSLQPLLTYTTYADDDAQALAWLGKAYLANKQDAAALDTFARALEIDPRQPEIFVQRGLLYLEREDGELARADFEAALALDKQVFTSALGLGRAQLLLGYNGEAYMQFNRSEGLARTDMQKAQLYYWRALSLEGLPEQDDRTRSAAVRDWESLLALPPEIYPKAWGSEAQQHLAALYTPTVTPRPATATATLKPASPTPTPTPARKATATRAPTRKP